LFSVVDVIFFARFLGVGIQIRTCKAASNFLRYGMSLTSSTAILAALDAQRKALPISRKKWLRAARVAESTFYRWQNGATVPTLRTLQRLERALAK
jgi:hypothetical protein